VGVDAAPDDLRGAAFDIFELARQPSMQRRVSASSSGSAASAHGGGLTCAHYGPVREKAPSVIIMQGNGSPLTNVAR
jgi:hypothetical protein